MEDQTLERIEEKPTAYIIDLSTLAKSPGEVVSGDMFKLVYMLSERARVAVISNFSYEDMRQIIPLDTIGFLSQGGNVADILVNGNRFPLWNKKLEKEDLRYIRKRSKQLLKFVGFERNEGNFIEHENVTKLLLANIPVKSQDELRGLLQKEIIELPSDLKYRVTVHEEQSDFIALFSRGTVQENVWDYFELLAQHQAVKKPVFLHKVFESTHKYNDVSTETVGETAGYIQSQLTLFNT